MRLPVVMLVFPTHTGQMANTTNWRERREGRWRLSRADRAGGVGVGGKRGGGGINP